MYYGFNNNERNVFIRKEKKSVSIKKGKAERNERTPITYKIVEISISLSIEEMFVEKMEKFISFHDL